MKDLIIISFLVLAACSTPASKNNESSQKDEPSAKKKEVIDSKYLLILNKVDNNVNVYVEDSLIFTSGTILNSPEVNFQIDFSGYITTGTETLKVELLNGLEPYNDQIDPLWEVQYDLIINGEIVDFVHEYGDDNGIGKVYENSYIINDWK